MSDAPPRDDAAPVQDDEIIYRRVFQRADYYNPETGLNKHAFSPTAEDDRGISFSRDAAYNTPQQAAEQGRAEKTYWIVEMSVALIRAAGFTVVADPTEGKSGHVLVTDLTTSTPRAESKQKMEALRQVALTSFVIHGPFTVP